MLAPPSPELTVRALPVRRLASSWTPFLPADCSLLVLLTRVSLTRFFARSFAGRDPRV